MEGYLEKWTHAFGGWHKRYFILSGNILMYSNEKGKPRKGIIPLENAKIIDKGEHRFDLETNAKVLYIKVPDSEIKKLWIHAIHSARNIENTKNFSKVSVIPAAMRNQYDINNEMSMNIPISDKDLINNGMLDVEQSNTSRINTMQVLLEDLKVNNEKLMKIKTKHKDVLQEIWYDNLKKIMELEHLLEIMRQSLSNKQISSSSCDSVKLLNNSKINNLLENNVQKLEKDKSKFCNSSIEVRPANIPIDTSSAEKLEYGNNINLPDSRLSVIRKDTDVFYEVDDGEDQTNIQNNTEQNPNNVDNFNKGHIFLDNNKNLSENNTINYNLNESQNIKNNNYNISENTLNQSLTTSSNYPGRAEDFSDKAYNKKRTALSVPRVKVNFSIWSILKDAVGKDLTKFSVPVYFNEPISMIQRFCEAFQYVHLLNRAAKEDNSAIRLGLVAAFVIGGFSMNPKRILKFFNPLLGETYEYIDNELNFRYFGEQVSHHPPISAAYVEGEGFRFEANMNAKTSLKLMRNCVEIDNIGRAVIYFKKYDEYISFSRPYVGAKNLLGNTYIDCYGKYTVVNHTLNESIEVKINDKKGKNNTYGEIKDSYGNKQGVFEGDWLAHLELTVNGTETIWKRSTGEGDDESRYFFTNYTLNMNNINETLKQVIAPTDSRLRPDQRALEDQNIDLAIKEKERLEQKQREVRKIRENNKEVYKPVYFEERISDITGEKLFLQIRDYWKDREARNFSHLPDIF